MFLQELQDVLEGCVPEVGEIPHHLLHFLEHCLFSAEIRRFEACLYHVVGVFARQQIGKEYYFGGLEHADGGDSADGRQIDDLVQDGS